MIICNYTDNKEGDEMEELINVEQLARMLNMHPRTIRRYIREGQLKATKVGGEWRIRREEAEAFIGGRVDDVHRQANEEINRFFNVVNGECAQEFQVCTVLDCEVDDPEEALQISQIIIQHMHADDPDRGKAKFQYYYLSQEKKGRYVLWGTPGFIGKLLIAIEEKAK